MEIFIVLILIAVVAVVISKKSKGGESTPAAQTQTAFFPCVIEGSVDAPPMEDRVKALAIEAQSKGITITGNYEADVKAQGGEMMLVGYGFKFVVDASGQIVADQSRCNIFGVDYPCNGGITNEGVLGIGVNVGGAIVSVTGRIVNGKLVDGRLIKGWLPHIYGVLNGTWSKA